MKIFDMHIHANNTKPDPEALLNNMQKAGVWGGCIFSNKPKLSGHRDGTNYANGTSFDERLKEVLEWTKGYEDRLFPVLWIHPDEENIIENIHKAVGMGIDGFKFICNEYYVYEDKCMELLREIAKLGKPVFFHSGILWGGEVDSSKYNRPLNWEAVMEIEGLRFSMGHCSWPWIDECIAMYGKFLNSLIYRNTAEMFFDLTPGTPKIYREELLTKLYTIGYDVGNNVLYGTDAVAENYNFEWASMWIKKDGDIMNKLGVSKDNLELLYHKNLMRFLGKTNEKTEHMSPISDASNEWTPVNKSTKEIICNWYKKLDFAKKYDDEFYEALEEVKISDAITAENYNIKEKDGKRNLLSYLYMCDELSKKYAEKGISEDILLDTLKDIVIWTEKWSDLKNELYLGELLWLSRHMNMKLFKLGRLQFCMAEAEHDIPNKGITKGDNVIEIHIPEGEPLDMDECKKSIEFAKRFFEEYFPEFKYQYFTTKTWLLDDTLKDLLPFDSNILKFQSLFEIISKEKSDAILGYVFKRNTNRNNVRNSVCNSSFAVKVKERVLAGGDFYESLGVIRRLGD